MFHDIQNSNYSNSINDKISKLENSAIEGGYGFYPVHTYPTNYDHQFNLYRSDECPGISKYINEARNTKEMKDLINETCSRINETYGEYIFNFMNISGVEEPDYLFDYSNLFTITDTFIADYYNGREMKIINDTLINMEEFYHECLNLSYIESYLRQFGIPVSNVLYIGISPIFRTLFNYMDMRINLDKKGQTDKKVSESPIYDHSWA